MKASKRISMLSIMSAIVLLLSLLLSLVNITGAWFSDSSGSSKNINVVVKTGEANVNVYQEDANGTQTLLSKSLPTGYTQLEYIESDGQGVKCIDTNIKPSTSLKLSFGVVFNAYTGGSFIGVGNTDVDDYRFFAFGGAAYFDAGDNSTNRIAIPNVIDLNTYYDVELGDFYMQINGTTYSSDSKITTTDFTNNNILIFSPGNNDSSGKIYYTNIWDNGVLVRNLIPAKQDSDSAIGMFDLVEGKFYTNAGSGTFTAGAETMAGTSISLAGSSATNNKIQSTSLPSGYTQLEYLQSDGKQCIDTGIVPTSNMRFVGNTYCQKTTGSGDNYIFSSGTRYDNFVGILLANAGSVLIGSGSVVNSYYGSSVVEMGDCDCYNFDMSVGDTKTIIKSNFLSNEIKEITYTSRTLTTANIHLFNASWYRTGYMVRIYNFTMYSENVLVRDFVPAKNANGVLGMYDLVEGKFYTNSGSGSFTAGDEVNTNQLKLVLKNEDLGKSFGVRFKATMYAATATGKVELDASFAGFSAPTSSQGGWVYDNGWYYYRNSAGENIALEPATMSDSTLTATERYLFTSFTINENEAYRSLIGGNALYLVVELESVAV